MNEIQKSYLLETAKWQKFLGILMAVCTALLAAFGIAFIAFGNFLNDPDLEGLGSFSGAVIGVFYLLLALLYVFFTRYLLRSAKYLKAWCASDAEEDLTEGLKNNKSYFKFSGILAIIGLGLIAIMLICVVIAAVVAA